MFQLPPLDDEILFERLILDILNEIEGNQYQLFGRRGQEQKGIDIVNIRSIDERTVIQCKKKDINQENKKISKQLIQDIETDIKKLRGLNFKYTRFILASTFKNDAAIQEYLLSKSDLLEINFEYWGWETITQYLSKYPNLVTKYYPQFIQKQNYNFDDQTFLYSIRNNIKRYLNDYALSSLINEEEITIQLTATSGEDVITNPIKKIISKINDKETRTVIVSGQAGCGKSFLVHKVGIQIIESSKEFIPVLINLSQVDTELLELKNFDSILKKIINEFIQNALSFDDRKYFLEKFDYLRSKGKILFIFDSFDETPGIERFTHNSERAKQLSFFISRFIGESKAIIATRDQANIFTKEIGSKANFRLKDLSESDIEDFLSDNGFNEEYYVKQINGNMDIYQYLQNPMFLALWVDLFNEERGLPRSIAEILRDYLLERCNRENHKETMLELNINLKDYIYFFSRVAKSMGRKNYCETSKVKADFPQLNVEDYLQFGYQFGIIRFSKDKIYFKHQWFFSFFLAISLSQGSKQQIENTIFDSIKTETNRETIKILFELCDEQFRSQIINTLIKDISLIKKIDSFSNPQYKNIILKIRFLKSIHSYSRNLLSGKQKDLFAWAESMFKTGNILIIKHSIDLICLVEDNAELVEQILKLDNEWLNESLFENYFHIKLKENSFKLLTEKFLRTSFFRRKIGKFSLVKYSKLKNIHKFHNTEIYFWIFLIVITFLNRIMKWFEINDFLEMVILDCLLVFPLAFNFSIISQFFHLRKIKPVNGIKKFLKISLLRLLPFYFFIFQLWMALQNKQNTSTMEWTDFVYPFAMTLSFMLLITRFIRRKEIQDQAIYENIELSKNITKEEIEDNLDFLETVEYKIKFIKDISKMENKPSGQWNLIFENNFDESMIYLAELEEKWIGLAENFDFYDKESILIDAYFPLAQKSRKK